MAAEQHSAGASADGAAEAGALPWVALVGPEVEDNLGMRCVASALTQAGFGVEILALNSKTDVATVRDDLASAEPPPAIVGVSFADREKNPGARNGMAGGGWR